MTKVMRYDWVMYMFKSGAKGIAERLGHMIGEGEILWMIPKFWLKRNEKASGRGRLEGRPGGWDQSSLKHLLQL